MCGESDLKPEHKKTTNRTTLNPTTGIASREKIEEGAVILSEDRPIVV